MVDDLHRLVTYSSPQEKPFILVGAEMGAVVSRFYAQIYES
jgi:surfactin synthase thioesterase subunit